MSVTADKKVHSIIQFENYRILSFSFLLSEFFDDIKEPVVDVKLDAEHQQVTDENYTIRLNCSVNGDSDLSLNSDHPFSIHLTIVGYFSTQNFDEKMITNSIAILFPYLRSIISTVTAQAGISPFILPTVNVNSLVNELERVEEK